MSNKEFEELFKDKKDYVRERFLTCRQLVLNAKPKKVLDLGCNNGAFLSMLGDDVEKYGLDLVEPDRVHKSVIYRKHDLTTKFPFSDNEFDVVHTAEVVEHLMDTVAYLQECFRVLKPGGHFVLSTPNLHYWRNLVLWVKGQQFFFVDYRGDQEGHVRYFCNGSLRETALKVGFNDINIQTVGNWPTQSLFLKVIAPFFKLFAPMKHLVLIMNATKP